MDEQIPLWDDGQVLHNVFFAVRPNPETAAAIARLAHGVVRDLRLTAHLLPPERLHVSLYALGVHRRSYPLSVINEARAIASTVSLAPFLVEFDRVKAFAGGNGKRALALTGGEGVIGLNRLQQALSSAMSKAGVPIRQRRFTPHLTMMYADCACELFIEPMFWTVDEFVLVDSLYGRSKHVLLDRWPR
jgi:RNA 2',3'-cyclic 3'-phosphodiesterase